MSYLTYNPLMAKRPASAPPSDDATPDKPLVWLHGEVKTPPFTAPARCEAGFLLRRLQQGEALALPHSRPMPGIGRNCHELRLTDETGIWRIVYHLAPEAIVILEVFQKKTQQTPAAVLDNCRRRLALYLHAMQAAQTKTAPKKSKP